MKDVELEKLKTIKALSGIEEILKKPLVHDAILIGLTDEQGINEMKAEGFVPLGWDPADGAEPLDIEKLYHDIEENDKDRKASGSEDQAEG